MSKLMYICDYKRHLICLPYSVPNLHAMAEDLGLKRCWFHSKLRRWHYDIPKRRIGEIAQKCILVTPEHLLELIKLHTEA